MYKEQFYGFGTDESPETTARQAKLSAAFGHLQAQVLDPATRPEVADAITAEALSVLERVKRTSPELHHRLVAVSEEIVASSPGEQEAIIDGYRQAYFATPPAAPYDYAHDERQPKSFKESAFGLLDKLPKRKLVSAVGAAAIIVSGLALSFHSDSHAEKHSSSTSVPIKEAVTSPHPGEVKVQTVEVELTPGNPKVTMLDILAANADVQSGSPSQYNIANSSGCKGSWQFCDWPRFAKDYLGNSKAPFNLNTQTTVALKATEKYMKDYRNADGVLAEWMLGKQAGEAITSGSQIEFQKYLSIANGFGTTLNQYLAKAEEWMQSSSPNQEFLPVEMKAIEDTARKLGINLQQEVNLFSDKRAIELGYNSGNQTLRKNIPIAEYLSPLRAKVVDTVTKQLILWRNNNYVSPGGIPGWQHYNFGRGNIPEYWCANFASWVDAASGLKLPGTDTPNSHASGDYYRVKDIANLAREGVDGLTYHPANSGYIPEPGDMVIYPGYSHINFLLARSGQQDIWAGGDQTNVNTPNFYSLPNAAVDEYAATLALNNAMGYISLPGSISKYAGKEIPVK